MQATPSLSMERTLIFIFYPAALSTRNVFRSSVSAFEHVSHKVAKRILNATTKWQLIKSFIDNGEREGCGGHKVAQNQKTNFTLIFLFRQRCRRSFARSVWGDREERGERPSRLAKSLDCLRSRALGVRFPSAGRWIARGGEGGGWKVTRNDQEGNRPGLQQQSYAQWHSRGRLAGRFQRIQWKVRINYFSYFCHTNWVTLDSAQ